MAETSIDFLSLDYLGKRQVYEAALLYVEEKRKTLEKAEYALTTDMGRRGVVEIDISGSRFQREGYFLRPIEPVLVIPAAAP